MRFLRVFLPLLVIGLFAFTPHMALAAESTFFGPIIPVECHCDGSNGQPASAPDFKCVLATLENGMNFAISIGIIIFVLVAAFAGFLLMFSPINQENRSKAKGILTNAVIGLLIALAAWLAVDFIMKTLYNEKWGPWNSILGDTGSACLVVRTPPAGPSPSTGTDGVTTTDPTNPTPTTPGPMAVGTRVQCYQANPENKWPGVITAIKDNGATFTVDYDEHVTGDVAASHCEPITGPGTPTDPVVNVGSQIVSANAVNVLKGILRSANLTSATISSGWRDPANQARVMYDNLVATPAGTPPTCNPSYGVACQKVLYGQYGDQVIDEFVLQRNAGRNATEIKAAMTAKINQIGPGRVSAHSDSAHNTFDVAPSSISNQAAFTAALNSARSAGTIHKIILPPTDPAFHIEVTTPQ